MKDFSTSKKVASGIVNMIINAALLYGTYTILFVTYIAWAANLIMFGLHIMVIMMLLFVIFASDEDRLGVIRNKSLPVFIHVTIDFALIIMFTMSGWFYYAILCLIMAFTDYAAYKDEE